jgi:DNA-binding NarL/FixJ family response regulator
VEIIRVLIVDDHDVVRDGVRTLLTRRPGLEVCGEANCGAEALRKAQELKPDIVVVDLGMPDISGVDVTRQIRKIYPNIEVVVLTMYESHQFVRETMSAGARGYVLKSRTGRDLADAIRCASQQVRFISPEVSEAMRPVKD